MSIPRPFQHLVDDAAIFPPGLAPLPEAVTAHVDHLAAAYADLVGPFVVDDARLDALTQLAPAGFAVSVVVPSPERVGAVLDRTAGLRLAGLEVRLDPARTPAEQAAQVAEIADRATAAPAGVATYVEAPRPTDAAWSPVRDAVVAHGLRLKLRTGGTEAAAFPSEAEVATWIADAVVAGVPFKCTAGLHHAVRHTGPDTGFEHHGYLNVLLATAEALAGGDPATVAAALAQRDPDALVAALDAVPADRLAAARGSFASYGSCSILEPLEDLTALHLLTV